MFISLGSQHSNVFGNNPPLLSHQHSTAAQHSPPLFNIGPAKGSIDISFCLSIACKKETSEHHSRCLWQGGPAYGVIPLG